MILQGLTISRALLDDVMDRKDRSRSNSKGKHERLRLVSEHDIVATLNRYPSCRCEEHGLCAGITVQSLLTNVTGCQSHWVCARLVALRRIYGH